MLQKIVGTPHSARFKYHIPFKPFVALHFTKTTGLSTLSNYCNYWSWSPQKKRTAKLSFAQKSAGQWRDPSVTKRLFMRKGAKWKHTRTHARSQKEVLVMLHLSTLTVSQSRLDHGAPQKMLSCATFRNISTYFNMQLRLRRNMPIVAFSSKDAWARSIWSNRT